MLFCSTWFHCDIDEMLQVLSSYLYQLAMVKLISLYVVLLKVEEPLKDIEDLLQCLLLCPFGLIEKLLYQEPVQTQRHRSVTRTRGQKCQQWHRYSISLSPWGEGILSQTVAPWYVQLWLNPSMLSEMFQGNWRLVHLLILLITQDPNCTK